jgi:hypothetical protein
MIPISVEIGNGIINGFSLLDGLYFDSSQGISYALLVSKQIIQTSMQWYYVYHYIY